MLKTMLKTSILGSSSFFIFAMNPLPKDAIIDSNLEDIIRNSNYCYVSTVGFKETSIQFVFKSPRMIAIECPSTSSKTHSIKFPERYDTKYDKVRAKLETIGYVKSLNPKLNITFCNNEREYRNYCILENTCK